MLLPNHGASRQLLLKYMKVEKLIYLLQILSMVEDGLEEVLFVLKFLSLYQRIVGSASHRSDRVRDTEEETSKTSKTSKTKKSTQGQKIRSKKSTSHIKKESDDNDHDDKPMLEGHGDLDDDVRTQLTANIIDWLNAFSTNYMTPEYSQHKAVAYHVVVDVVVHLLGEVRVLEMLD